MDLLPEEVLIEIFSYLSVTDRLSISLVSHHFDYLIASKKLSKIFTIHFPNRKHKNFWDVTRPYANIQITTNGNPQTFIPSSTFNSDVESLTIKKAAITGDILSKMFELCVNLQVVRFETVKYLGDVYDDSIHTEQPLRIKNLRLELVRTDFEVLKILDGCRVSQLVIEDYQHYHVDADLGALAEFLAKQNGLTELTMLNITQQFFSVDRYRSVSCPLRKLTLSQVIMPKDENFAKFVSNFVGCLRIFEIEKTAIQNVGEVLSKFEKLEELKVDLSDKTMRSLPKLRTVQRLCVSRKRMPKKWLEKYPNLKRIKLDGDQWKNV